MSHLIPQQRPDKNGKVVTRHVKADVAAASDSRTMPAPTLVEEGYKAKRIATIRASIEEAYNQFVSDEMSFYGGEDDEGYEREQERHWERLTPLDYIEMNLERFPDSTVEIVAQAIAESGFDTNYQLLLGDAVSGVKDGKDARAVEYFTFLYDRLDDIYNTDDIYSDDISNYEILKGAITGLGSYKNLGYEPPEHIFDATEEEKKVVLGLCRMRYASIDIASGSPIETDGKNHGEEIVPLILKHPEQADRIVDLMIERQTTDAELIRVIVESESQAVSTGHL